VLTIELARKCVLVAVGSLAAILLTLLLVASQAPVRLVSGYFSALGLAPLGDARLIEGSALLTAGDGGGVVHWQWCPRRGLTALCATLTLGSAYYSAELHPGIAGVGVTRLVFSGIDGAALGIAALAPEARVGGELDGLRFAWKDTCPHHGLATARGAIVVAGVPGGELRLQVAGDGAQGVAVSGGGVRGHFALAGDRVRGTLELPPRLLPEIGGPGLQGGVIEVAKAMPCRR